MVELKPEHGSAARKPIDPNAAPMDWVPKYLDRTDLPVGTIARWALLHARELDPLSAQILLDYAADKLEPRLLEMIASNDFQSLMKVCRIVIRFGWTDIRVKRRWSKLYGWFPLPSDLRWW